MKANHLAMMMVLTLISATGCKPNVEKLRVEQDLKEKQDKFAAINEYKSRYEAQPRDAVAAYLYARILPEAKPKLEIARALVKEHPDFAWGHHLLGWLLRERGELEGWKKEALRAAELEPNAKDIKEAAAETSRLLVVEAADFNAIWLPFWTGQERSTGRRMFSDFDQLERLSGVKRGVGMGFEILAAAHENAEEGYAAVKLFVKNTTSSPLEIIGMDSAAGFAMTGACFTDDGSAVMAKEGAYADLLGKENCLFCSKVSIDPGSNAVPNGFFKRSFSALTRCVFAGFPNTILLVKTNLK